MIMPKKGVMSDEEMFIDSVGIDVCDKLGFTDSNVYIDKEIVKLENCIKRLQKAIDRQNTYSKTKKEDE